MTRSTAPVAPRESPSRGAKDAANQRIAAQLAQRTPVPVAEVVHSPVSSPDGPLVPPPAVARAGASAGLGDDEDSSSSYDDSPLRPSRGVGRKTTGLNASPTGSPPPAFDYGVGDDDDDFPTDGEVSKYSFHQRLMHYMDGALIDQQNRKAVELAILVEAGTKVRDMDPIKKTTREQVLYRKYLEIIRMMTSALG